MKMPKAVIFSAGFCGGPPPADINGDGCTDLAYKHYTSPLRARISGCGVLWSGPELQGPAWSGAAQLHVYDWNSDGRDDLLVQGATTWQLVLSNGDSLAAMANTGVANDNATTSHPYDPNASSLDDLLTRAS